ncbi:MAG: hypothetical protein ABEK50_02080 [bacterium]
MFSSRWIARLGDPTVVRSRVVGAIGAVMLGLLLFPGSGEVLAQDELTIPGDAELQQRHYGVQDLLKWTRRGQGYVDDFRGEALQIAEQENSEGLILSSRESFGDRIVVRYRAFILTPGTVLVTMLSASNRADTRTLNIPVENRGGAGFWVNRTSNYFFAFHNAAHMKKPFVVRFNRGDKTTISKAQDWHMDTGRWHTVEVGRWGDRVWLKIDGNLLFRGTDQDFSSGGHVVLRTRGTGLQQANYMVSDLRILTPLE